MKKSLFFLVLLLSSTVVMAQNLLQGTVVDKATGETLIGVSVHCAETKKGTVTDIDGRFALELSGSEKEIILTYMGFADVTIRIKNGQFNLGKIEMDTEAIGLEDVIVSSQVAKTRMTPIAMSKITPLEIEEKLGTQEFPEILKSTPGIYATKQGGGYGDSRINMRGFESSNIAVMINGIPMNDMEWGGIYWSNWAGLGDVTRSMQTQRGLGASKVSSPSVGGSINIITRSTDAKMGGNVSYGIGNDGYNKIGFSASTGLLKSGWAFTILGSKTWGDGYIQGTDFSAYNYFVNISKKFGDNHQLSFTGFGAPQVHNQRDYNNALTIQGWQDAQKYMEPGDNYKYNPTFGYDKYGNVYNANKNSYHKPQLSLNYNWQIDYKSSLSAVFYVSIGDGWGYGGQASGFNGSNRSNWYGADQGAITTTFRNDDGTFNYGAMQALNEASTSGSDYVMSVSKNLHQWYGLVSTYSTEIGDHWKIFAGIDGRYYIGTHTNEIIDLFGGDYYIDASRKNVKAINNASAADQSWVMQKLKVGDVVYRDYDGHVAQGGVFGQAEMTYGKVNAFASVSGYYNNQWRYDRFYYDAEHAKSASVGKFGYSVKGGVNYNITEKHNIFANVGYISRTPYFSGGAFLQSTTSNAINPDAVNEKIFSVEIGYGFESKYFSGNINAYHTAWNDKAMISSFEFINSAGLTEMGRINMTGVNARHQGIELDFIARPTKWLDIKGMFSIGDWRWNNNPIGYYYDSQGQPLADKKGTIASGIQNEDHAYSKLLLKDIKVGNSAQTTAALCVNFKIGKQFRVGVDANYFGRNYSSWKLTSSNLIMNSDYLFEQPWMIPDAITCDLNASFNFKIGKARSVISGNINNIFNQTYITDAYDGSSHNWDTARVLYGFGRTMSARIKVYF